MSRKIKIKLTVTSRNSTHLDVGDEVEFSADEDCTVYFSDETVFGVPSLELTANQSDSLTVVEEGSTALSAFTPSTRERAKALSDPNDIIVP